MLKYSVFLIFVVALAVFYNYIKDPCNQQLSTDFSAKYPGYEILDSHASEGSPESVRCLVSFREPDSEQILEETWMYRYSKKGWEFSKIFKADKNEQP